MFLTTPVATSLALDFEPLHRELSNWREAGLHCRFWWRDDDLIADSPNFRQLCALAIQTGVQVMCSVIPAQLDVAFAATLRSDELMIFVQHGYAHVNHEQTSNPKSEFGPVRPLAQRLSDLRAGREKLEELLGENFVKVLVPPWNRLHDDMLTHLGSMGYVGLSQHGARGPSQIAPGVALVNTHVDILNWNAPGIERVRPAAHIASELARLLERKRLDRRDLHEPIGILSHHRVMDPNSWTVLAYMLESCQKLWCRPRELFVEELALKAAALTIS